MISVGELQKALNLQCFTASDAGLSTPVRGGYTGDLLSWVMSRAEPQQAWVTIMSNVNVAAVATLTEVACVILAEGVSPDEELLEVAKERGVCLLGSKHSAFSLCEAIAKLL